MRLFTKTPLGVVCPHFYELILSNGCPYNCSYCYLKLTFRGKCKPNLFVNEVAQVKKELDSVASGVFSTGELADSLAATPPLLPMCLDYFQSQESRYLLLTTKSTRTAILKTRMPSSKVIVSFSVNSPRIARMYEKGAPDPLRRLKAAMELKELGWRVRIRLDPLILDDGLEDYREICLKISQLKPEMVTVGSLRQYPGLFRFARNAPRQGLVRSPDGRMRYKLEARANAYRQIAEWLGFQPSLCKETRELYEKLSWEFNGCNCTLNGTQ